MSSHGSSSPFPGMDPYLEDERVWPDFQHQLVLSLNQILLPALVDRYRACLGQRQYVVDQSIREEFIEIRLRDGKLLTRLDIVSPTNRTTVTGRQAYLDTRKEARAVGANLVEVDFVLQGQPMLEYSRENLPQWDYAVTVARSTQLERHEIYTATLQKRLPRYRLPLAADDRDTVLDLHTAFNRCYDQGGFAARIDYQRDPTTKLVDEDRRWLADLLKEQKLR